MNNGTTLCCIGAGLCVFGLFLIPMLLRSLFKGVSSTAQGSSSQDGSIHPTYNDPNIQGHGSFGSNLGQILGNIRPHYNSPNIQGSGSFGRRRFGVLPSRPKGNKYGSKSSSKPPEAGHVDSDSVEGHGSFGRDKD